MTPKHELIPGLRPVHMGLFPSLDTLEAAIELGLSQLPITTSTQLMGIIMVYHNTLLKVQQDSHEKTT